METPNIDFIIPKWCKEACYERATATLFYANKKIQIQYKAIKQ